MNPEQSVLDEIDRLVDESLATPYSERSGYDNNIDQPDCRCGADWHGLPKGGCPGSDTEGPVTRSRWPAIEAVQRFAEHCAGMPYWYDGGAWQIPDDLFADTDGDGEVFIPLPTPATDEPQTSQQRALPRPSTAPPMWAARADGRRRR